jgi:hypothetical protein
MQKVMVMKQAIRMESLMSSLYRMCLVYSFVVGADFVVVVVELMNL